MAGRGGVATQHQARAEAILRRLDLLRDARYLGGISEEAYHARSKHLWEQLRRYDREAKEAARREERLWQGPDRERHESDTESGTALFCDGCCEGGRAGIGVVTRNGTIGISEEVRAATNNQAECLAIIRGLQECLRLGYRPAVVLSDSQLVVCWVDGRYAARSDTARTYTPEIRQLLKEAGTSLHWIPGVKNLADQPSREAIGVWRDPNLSPLQVACSTPVDRLRFCDLARLKSGRDQYSKLRLPTLAGMVDTEARKLVEAELGEEDQAKAYRWVLRGLPADAAVRKVQVDLQIGENAIRRGGRRR